MPIYEYRCSDCSFQNEYLQKISEPPMAVCPSCGHESFRKMLSAAGFQLKGSGWYATDFRNSGGKPAKPEAAKPEAAKQEAKPKSKGETAAASGQGACPVSAAN
jgi:putative FmdB family regulatory protein